MATTKKKMKKRPIIVLEEFRKVVKALADETKAEFPNLYFDYGGMIPIKDKSFRYDSTPINTEVFATSGGNGVHYSILEISEKTQPVIMTVPMNFGDSMKDYNCIIGENLNEFLSIGFYNGWFPMEQLYYNKDWVFKFYATENMEEDYQKDYSNIHFVKKLRTKLGYNHILLNNNRLKELENKYFQKLKFNPEFVEKHAKIIN